MHNSSLFDFPVDPPSVAVDTSEEAASRIKARAPSMRRTVLLLVIAKGGLICDEVEELTGLKHQTAAARLWDLEGQGLVEKSDQKRPTRSGCNARVYQATPKGLREAGPEHIGSIVQRVMADIRGDR